MSGHDESRLPLAGIRVLDLSRLMAGNMLTLQLADFGADVIKVGMHNVFPRLSRTPGRIRTAAPKLGQDQGLIEQDIHRRQA